MSTLAKQQVVVSDDGSVTIPPSLACALRLKPGSAVDLDVTPGGLWLRPADQSPDQWWYWTPEWQAADAEGESEAAGRPRRHLTTEQFIDELSALL